MTICKGLIAGAALLLLWQGSRAQDFEQRMLESLSAHRTPGMTHFMQGVSNTTSTISIAIPAGIFAVGALRHDCTIKYKGFYIAETIGISTALELALKYTINRPRPSDHDPLIIPASDNGGPSFPSGHVSDAFATATSLSLAYPKWYVIAPSFLWAATVGYSRMYLGVHYPSDVLGGAIVGAGSAWLSCKLNHWLFPTAVEKWGKRNKSGAGE
jgi:membrane-associated phospholipid phosphatase